MAARTSRQTRATVRWRGGWARLGPWRGTPGVGHVVVGASAPPTDTAVADCLDRLRSLGYEAVLTNALSPRDSLPFVNAGFEVRERLHLLQHEGRHVPPNGPDLLQTRRARRADRTGVLGVDARAFTPFWQLESAGLDDALRATPAVRFRIGTAVDGSIAAYAVAGRAGAHGYLQRVAVDPSARRQGWGRALVVDALQWLVRHDVRRTLVNTQLDNVNALALYESCGFRHLPVGLCVLGRAL